MIDRSSIFQTLLHMKNLRTLTLIECNNHSFIRVLNPGKNSSGTIVCPNLEEIILYVERPDWFCTSELKEMGSVRVRRYAKCPYITLVSLGKMPPKEVFTLKPHFPRVEFKVDVESPEWDALPGGEGMSDGE